MSQLKDVWPFNWPCYRQSNFHATCNACQIESDLCYSAICVQAYSANIFSRFFTFETARFPIQTACLRWKRECYRSANEAAILGV